MPERAQPFVILVDDEAEFLEIASLKLHGSGFETFTTTNAREAIAKAEDIQPDLVLSDIYMVPGPSGWDLALELHRNPKTRAIKLAFFTTLRDPWIDVPPEMRQEILTEIGHPVFFSKTDDVEALGSRIKGFLGPRLS